MLQELHINTRLPHEALEYLRLPVMSFCTVFPPTIKIIGQKLLNVLLRRSFNKTHQS